MLRLVWRLLVVEFGVKPSRGLRRISAWRSVVRWSMCLKTALQPAHFPANPFRSFLFHAWVFLFGKGCGFDEVLGWVCSILIGGLPAQIWSLGGASPVSFSDLFSPTGDCVCSVFSSQRFSLALSRRHSRRPILCGGAEVRLTVMQLNWSEWQLGFSGVAMNNFFGMEPLERPRRSYQRRDLLNRVYASDEARVYAVDRAEKLQSSLDPEFPSFVKPMLQSHVTGGFWLGLPLHFCKAHLPKRDTMMTLVDEEDEDFMAKYLAEKTGLSGGWRGFAIDHQLVDGDAVVFHLITPTMFKVYIIRVNDDGNNDSDGNEEDKENDIEPNEKQEENVSEGRQLRSSVKRKRGGRK